MVTTPPQQFCVRWNSYQSNLQNAFPKLLTSEHFVDVTLACENEMLKCHKVVLSACSTYFEKLLLDNPCQHPIIFMKDMKFQEMQSLVDFMYKGEVNVTQDDLPSLLKSAEALQIRGLCGSDQLFSQSFGNIKLANQQQQQQQPQTPQQQQQQLQQQQTPQKTIAASINADNKQTSTPKTNDIVLKKEDKTEGSESGNNPSSSECDSNDGMLQIKDLDQVAKLSPTILERHTFGELPGSSRIGRKYCKGCYKKKTIKQITKSSVRKVTTFCADCPEDADFKEELCEDDSYFDGDSDLLDTEFMEEDGPVNTGDVKTDFAIANVSCQYDGTTGSATNRRIRRSDEELRRAAECITRGQTFQTVSDQFNIPISTIRFYMARKGILPRRKRGRACAGPTGMGMPISTYNSPGNTSPIGPPYHIVHYKLPALGVSKLK